MVEGRFYLRLSDHPFNISTLTRRIKSSAIWNSHRFDSYRAQLQTKHINGDSLRQANEIEFLLFDAIRSCKLLHRKEVGKDKAQINRWSPTNSHNTQLHQSNKTLPSKGWNVEVHENRPVLPLFVNLQSATLSDYGYEYYTKYLSKTSPATNTANSDRLYEAGNGNGSNYSDVTITATGSSSMLVAELRKVIRSSSDQNHIPKAQSKATKSTSEASNVDAEFNTTIFSQSKPLDLLVSVMDRNSTRLTAPVLYEYLTTAPYPPTQHAIELIKQFKTNTWIPSTTFQLLDRKVVSSLRSDENSSSLDPNIASAVKELSEYNAKGGNIFTRLITKLGSYDRHRYANQPDDYSHISPRQQGLEKVIRSRKYKDGLTVSDFCWIAIRNSVYRQEFNEAFKLVDIATKDSYSLTTVKDAEPSCNKMPNKLNSLPEIHFPKFTLKQRMNILYARISRSSSLQLQISSTFSFLSFISAYLAFLNFPFTSTKFNVSEPLTDTIAASADVYSSTYASFAGILVLSAIVSLSHSMIYFYSIGGSLRSVSRITSATQRVRWTPATLWQDVLPKIIKNGSFFAGLTNILRSSWNGSRGLGSFFVPPWRTLVSRNSNPTLSKSGSELLCTGQSKRLTNLEYERLSELDRKVLELKMVDYIAVSFDEVADVTVDNYHLFGEAKTRSITDDFESVDSNGKNKSDIFKEEDALNEDLKVYPASAIDISTREILPLRDTHKYRNSRVNFTKKSRSENLPETALFRKGSSIAKSRAQTVLMEQLIKRNMRIKETSQERLFNEYWTFSGESYVWVEPDQDPSTNILRRLRYCQKW